MKSFSLILFILVFSASHAFAEEEWFVYSVSENFYKSNEGLIFLEFKIPFNIINGHVNELNIFPGNAFVLNIESNSNGSIEIKLPRILTEPKHADKENSFYILIDGNEKQYEVVIEQCHYKITIPFEEGAKIIDVIPESHDPRINFMIRSGYPEECNNESTIQTENPKETLLILPPKKQVALGISPENIVCIEGLELIFKNNNSPACVKPATAQKLVERGWGSFN